MKNGGDGVFVWLGDVGREEMRRSTETLQVIHGRGLVHGDVRWPNILVSEDDINFVDFDHCGQDGVMRYPREWDHTYRPRDAKEGDLMKITHDEWMLERVFESESSRRGFYRS